jgi:hypothetical protein
MEISDQAAKRRRARVRSWAILVAWVLLLWAALSAVRAHATGVDPAGGSIPHGAISRASDT